MLCHLFPLFSLVHFCHRYIRSERSVILINFCLSIISSNALILIGQTQTWNKVQSTCDPGPSRGSPQPPPGASSSPPLQVLCTLIAAFLHFFFLSSFCWVLTEAWQSYMAVTGRLRNRIIRKRFLCLGWGGPSFYCSRLLFVLPPPSLTSLLSPQVFLLWWWPSRWASPRPRATGHRASEFLLQSCDVSFSCVLQCFSSLTPSPPFIC